MQQLAPLEDLTNFKTIFSTSLEFFYFQKKFKSL
jgi:hypothetical protein